MDYAKTPQNDHLGMDNFNCIEGNQRMDLDEDLANLNLLFDCLTSASPVCVYLFWLRQCTLMKTHERSWQSWASLFALFTGIFQQIVLSVRKWMFWFLDSISNGVAFSMKNKLWIKLNTLMKMQCVNSTGCDLSLFVTLTRVHLSEPQPPHPSSARVE